MPDMVMVIEDEKEIRELVRYNLERAGYRVHAVGDGEQGLENLFASRPDLLVLDLMLPGRNGFEIRRMFAQAEEVLHTFDEALLRERLKQHRLGRAVGNRLHRDAGNVP